MYSSVGNLSSGTATGRLVVMVIVDKLLNCRQLPWYSCGSFQFWFCSCYEHLLVEFLAIGQVKLELFVPFSA